MSNTKVNKLESMLFKGKAYSTTAQRIAYFRREFDFWSIETELLRYDDKVAIVKAIVKDETGRILSTGMAKEFLLSAEDAKNEAYAVAKSKARADAKYKNINFDVAKFDANYDFEKPVFAVNVTSHLENAETGAIGRALANLGIGIEGASIASYEEVVNAEAQSEAKQALVQTKPITIEKADGEVVGNLAKEGISETVEEAPEVTKTGKILRIAISGNSSFNFKGLLKENKYRFNPEEKNWFIEVDEVFLQTEKDWLFENVFNKDLKVAQKDCKITPR